MKAYHNTAVLKFDDETTGNAASGAPVTVRINNTQALASIFDVDDVSISNPLTTDSNGNYSFKSADNIYDIIVSEGTANEVKLEKVEIVEFSNPTASDLFLPYEFATVAEFKASLINFPDGKIINTLEYSTGNGGGASYTKISGTGTANDMDIVASTGISQSITLTLGMVIHTAKFGAVHNSTDVTAATQRAMDVANTVGINHVIMPDGIGYLSIAESVSTTTCLELPANVYLRGQGRENTALQRLPAERAVDGVLICNRNYDTIGGYGAEGNSELSHFEITDGAVSPTRPNGDLIGLGHCRNVKIHDMQFGNHDQHAIDICSCSNVEIYQNTGLNEGGLAGAAGATIQIDNAFGIGILGLFISVPGGGGTYAEPTEMIDIWGNDLRNDKSPCIEICHGAWGRYKAINIHDNPRLAAGTVAGVSPIKLDNDQQFVHLEGMIIANNGIEGLSSSTVLISLFNDRGRSSYSNIEVYGNYGVTKDQTGSYTGTSRFQTLGETAIYIGNNTAFIQSDGEDLTFKQINVHDNNFILTGTSVSMRPYMVVNCNGQFRNNYAAINIGANVNQPLFYIDTPRGLEVSGNATQSNTQSGSIGANSASIQLLKTLDFPCSAVIKDNYLTGDNMNYNFLHVSNVFWDVAVDEILLSGNRFTSGATLFEISEDFAMSDGTNGWKQIDMGGADGMLALSASLNSTQNIGMKKLSSFTGMKFQTQYASQALAATFEGATEQLQHAYISATEWVGTQIAQQDLSSGQFKVLTGTNGTSIIINDTTFQPVIRTGGGLKVWAGI